MTAVGNLERSNPLPVGQYWIDVFGLNIPKFDAWLTAFGPTGVHTDATEHFEATEVPNVRTWYKFSVKGTLPPWDARTFGFPTVADASIRSSEDTVQRPDLPLDITDRLGNWIDGVESDLAGSLGSAAKVVPYAIIGGGLYALWLMFGSLAVTKTLKRKKKQSGK